MKNIILFLSLILFTNCSAQKINLKKFPDDKVMVVAHRGDWRNAPENSIWAIRKAIEKGAHMAEIDLALTKDSVLILMHDKTLDRTTTGTGKPSDYTYDEIQEFYLKDGLGMKTEMRIPTLENILLEAKGKIFLNLDKGFDYISLVYPLLKKHDMLNEVLFKGNVDYKTFDNNYGDIKDEIIFMPIVRLVKGEGKENIEDYLSNNYIPYGIEFTVGLDESKLIDFNYLREKGIKVWLNSLWPQHNAHHNDDIALENPDVYSWYVDKEVNIIQTDRIAELISFLKKNKLYVSIKEK